jgi:hypothetical protein
MDNPKFFFYKLIHIKTVNFVSEKISPVNSDYKYRMGIFSYLVKFIMSFFCKVLHMEPTTPPLPEPNDMAPPVAPEPQHLHQEVSGLVQPHVTPVI